LAQAARGYHYDWKVLAAHAEAVNSLRILLLGVLLAHDLLAAPIPSALVDAAHAEPSVERAARIFCRYLNQLGAAGPGLVQRWSIPLAMISQRPSCFRYALARAFLPAPRDFDFVSLPYGLWPLYYVVRPLRFALEKVLIRSASAKGCSTEVNSRARKDDDANRIPANSAIIPASLSDH
jgi:hypothetical protein